MPSMKQVAESSTQEVLAGIVERVTFHNAESGFCVLRIKARGHRDLVTVVGHAATISAGESATASDEWVNDRTHGQQFKARFIRTSPPTSVDGIEKYLGSGMIRGIGPVYAKKMVRTVGEKVFDVIEAEPDRLREITGIGPMRAKQITDAWAEQKIVCEIMVFLHRNGVGTARAVRIFCESAPKFDPFSASNVYPSKGPRSRVKPRSSEAMRGGQPSTPIGGQTPSRFTLWALWASFRANPAVSRCDPRSGPGA